MIFNPRIPYEQHPEPGPDWDDIFEEEFEELWNNQYYEGCGG